MQTLPRPDRRLRRIALGAALCCLSLVAAAAAAAPIETRHLQSLGEVEYHAFHSESLRRGFHVFVDLPEDYAESTDSYPAVYLLDGGNTLPLAAAQHHFLRFGDEAAAAILVGISYGADTFREGNLRQTDFTAPAAARDFWGGAGAFQAMLSRELIPMIEQRYRANPARRILFGNSLGGQFVLYTALTRPDQFHGLIASSPVISLNAAFFREWHGDGEMPAEAGRLFVSVGELEREELSSPLHDWLRFWQSAAVRPWILEYRLLPGQTHYSAVPEALRQGLQWLLPAGEPAGVSRSPR